MSLTPAPGLRPTPCVEAEEEGKADVGVGVEGRWEQVWRGKPARLSKTPVVRDKDSLLLWEQDRKSL